MFVLVGYASSRPVLYISLTLLFNSDAFPAAHHAHTHMYDTCVYCVCMKWSHIRWTVRRKDLHVQVRTRDEHIDDLNGKIKLLKHEHSIDQTTWSDKVSDVKVAIYRQSYHLQAVRSCVCVQAMFELMT